MASALRFIRCFGFVPLKWASSGAVDGRPGEGHHSAAGMEPSQVCPSATFYLGKGSLQPHTKFRGMVCVSSSPLVHTEWAHPLVGSIMLPVGGLGVVFYQNVSKINPFHFSAVSIKDEFGCFFFGVFFVRMCVQRKTGNATPFVAVPTSL